MCYWHNSSLGQQYYDATNTPRQYYYNNFGSATVGDASTFLSAAGSTRNSSSATIDIVSSSSLNVSKSLSTVGMNAIGYIRWNFFGTGSSSTSLSGATWEWEFDYKNTTGASPNDPNPMVANTDSWRYWLIANSYSGNNTLGLYVTATGGNLKLRLKYNTASNQFTDYASIALANNKDTYQIRIVKSVIGYYDIYILDRTTNTTTSKLNINVGTNVSGVDLNTYNYSYLEATSAANDRFQWDNINFYRQRVDYVPITGTINGISSIVYPGGTDVIPYGVNVNIRGDIIFGRITFNSANNGQALFTGGTLYKTSSSYLSPGTGTSLATYSVNNVNTSQVSLPSSEYYYSAGNTDGTTSNVVNYFLDMTARSPFYSGYPTTISYSVSTADADTYQSFYTSGYFPVSGSASTGPNVVAGNVYDWVGNVSSDWNDKNNWSPATVPGINDQARIAAAHPFSNPPIVSLTGATSVNVGSILFGNVIALAEPGITVNSGCTLNVSGDITKQSDTHSYFNNTAPYTTYLAGSGTIKAANINIISNTSLAGFPYTENITTSVSQLTISGNAGMVSNVIGGYAFNAALNITGGNTTLSGVVKTTNTAGSTSSLIIYPTTTATLQLANATALSGLSSLGTNTITFGNTGATVDYSGAAQTVYTDAAITGLPAGVNYMSLKFSGTGIKTALSGNLDIAGDFTNTLANDASNYANLSSPTVNFDGTAQNLYGGAGNGTTFYNVAFSGLGTKKMQTGKFDVSSSGVLTMAGTSTSTVLNANGLLTLRSTATSSATVAAINGPQITGNVNVERYITGGAGYRGYRLLTSPVYNATVSSNNVYSINYLSNSCYLTGTTGTTGGFDKPGNPTIYLYRENLAPLYNSFLNSNFRGINTISTSPNYIIDQDAGTFNILAGDGFQFFFRGDRSAANLADETVTTYVPVSATLTATGMLNQGTIAVRDWYTPATTSLSYSVLTGNTPARGFHLVGNPYASSINWDTYGNDATTSGILVKDVSKTIYSYNTTNKNYAAYTAGGGLGSNGATNIIASGQGFFIVDTTANGTITFKESAKVNTQVSGSNLLMGKPADVASLQYIRLQLAKDSVNTDDMVVRFSNTASAQYVVNEDAPYKQGYGTVSICSISSNNIDLAINQLPFPQKTEVVGLNVNVSTDGIYKLSLTQLVDIPQLYDIWLMDAYKKDSLDIRNNPSGYSFNVYKNDSTSFGAKRFSLVIKQNPAYAYRLLDFNALKLANATPQVEVVWKTENESNYTYFTVERSINNGKSFDVIGSQTGSSQGTYSFIDQNPVTGQNQYRLKQEDINGTFTYSNIVTIMYADKNSLASAKISVYPNPANNVINLAIAPAANASSYQISITNSSGLIIKQGTASQNSWQASLSNLLPGTYLIEVLNGKDKSLVGKSKFVKL